MCFVFGYAVGDYLLLAVPSENPIEDRSHVGGGVGVVGFEDSLGRVVVVQVHVRLLVPTNLARQFNIAILNWRSRVLHKHGDYDMAPKLKYRYCYDSSDQYMEYYDRVEVDAKLSVVAGVLKETLRWATNTTNSDADNCIKRVRECLEEL